ncbi:hypothetical protein CROQUDRAFT_135924 [Cronartium quercuum f. sp. fusiforme G11]|uniref:UME domain-containing protein n=1 Tax=Cronartium quercuum f. sp. fusiforme G11 TaxID=708437 RepID=A0A9P6N8E9_9BASI|nr:hypothetical protein CROQUDRAFT_135924 [Cronartium quercuum f. sp. fusiforme G11]
MNANGFGILLQLLGMTLDAFLIQTADHIVPRLVSTKNMWSLDRLTKANKETTSNILSDNMVRILTDIFLNPDLRLMQREANNLLKILNRGAQDTNPASRFSAHTLAQWCGSPLCFNLLVEMEGPVIDYPKKPPTWALRQKAFWLAKPEIGFSTATTLHEHEVEKELRYHMLAILTQMNKRLQNLRGKYLIGHKVKVMHGLSHMIGIVNTGVNSFIPPITISLQASLSIPPLRDPTSKAWDLFFNSFSLEDLKASIGQITAAFVSVWTKLTPYQLDFTVKLLHQIVKNSKELGEINDENEVVVTQSLKELKKSLCLDVDEIRLLTSGDSFDPVVGGLHYALTGVAIRFNNLPDEVRSLIFECLGILGAIDPDRFEMPDDTPGFISACDFSDYEDSIKFATHLIQDELTGACFNNDLWTNRLGLTLPSWQWPGERR